MKYVFISSTVCAWVIFTLVHIGTRIDTGRNPFGAGGSYTGTITMSYVPYAKWIEVFFEKYAQCS